MGNKKCIVTIVVSTLLISMLAGSLLVKAQTSSTGQTVGPLVNLNLVYAYTQGNSAVVILNVTRIANFGENSSTTLVDMYRIHIFINGTLIASQGLAFFSNNNLPMTSSNGINIMDIVVSVPAVNSNMAIPPDNLGQSSLEPFSVVIDNSGIPTNSEVPEIGNDSLTVEWMGAELFNLTSLLGYSGNNETLIQQVNLESFQGGYLYNTIYSQDQLSQIDLLNPTQSTPSTPPPSSSPSPPPSTSTPTPTPPSRTPSPSIPEFPTWVILPLFAAAMLLSIVFAIKRNSANRNVSD